MFHASTAPPCGRRGRVVSACVAWLVVTAGAGTAVADARAVADRVLACTVGISCDADGGSFTGTGCVVSPSGHVVTVTSVVPAGATDVSVMFPGYVRRPATVVAVDEALGTTLLKVDAADLPCLPVSRGLPALGATVYTAGDVDRVLVSNGRASFSRGVVSGLYDVAKRGENDYQGMAIETTAAVNPGSDGGPLVDAAGSLCGVISLGVSPLRWQGVAVPTQVLCERFAPFRQGDPAAIAITSADAAADAAADRTAGLRAAAAAVLPALVGIEVKRRHGPEVLPQPSWTEHRAGIADWNKLPAPERTQRFAAFANLARGLEVNQLLRRPVGPMTGLVIAPDGAILTSLFNVGDDTAFVSKKTGTVRSFDASQSLKALLTEPDGGLQPQPNTVTSITVTLADGSRHEAKVVSRHEPLGVALLSIEATDLPWFDLAGTATSPQLGDEVAVVGYLPGSAGRHTLNTGIVSAPSRDRGYRFQTDALLNYGNSGGPVVDAAGNFLGLAAAPIEPDTVLGRMYTLPELMRWTRAPNSGVGLVSRGDRIRDAFEEMKGGRSWDRIPGPYIGVLADTARAFGEDVFVGGVVPGSPAEAAGVKKGDKLLELDGVELATWRDLTDRIAGMKAGDVVVLRVERRGSGPRLVIAGRDIETTEDLARLRKSLRPGETFEGTLTTDGTRELRVVLQEHQ